MNIFNITSFSLSYYFAMLNPTKNIRIKFITDTGGYMNTTVRYLWTLHSIYTSTKLHISCHIVVKQKHTYCCERFRQCLIAFVVLLVLPLQYFETGKKSLYLTDQNLSHPLYINTFLKKCYEREWYCYCF